MDKLVVKNRAYLSMACPYCKAGVFNKCLSSPGVVLNYFVHEQRKAKYYAELRKLYKSREKENG